MDGADDESAVDLCEVLITSLVIINSSSSSLMLSLNSIAVPTTQTLQVISALWIPRLTLRSKEKVVSTVSFEMFYVAYGTPY